MLALLCSGAPIVRVSPRAQVSDTRFLVAANERALRRSEHSDQRSDEGAAVHR